MRLKLYWCLLMGVVGLLPVNAADAPAMTGEVRVALAPEMLKSSSPLANFAGLVDEQEIAGNPPSGKPERGWDIPSQHWKSFPYHVVMDLGQARNLSALWVYDSNGTGEFVVFAGQPGQWREAAKYDCNAYLKWVRLPLDVTTRHLKVELNSPGANFREMVLYEYTAEAHRQKLAQAEAAAKLQQEREAALRQAQVEIARRPIVELPPFGQVLLVDEVDCGSANPGHQFRRSPEGADRVETILGRSARVLPPTVGEASYLAFRLGRWKLLRPGGVYVLAVEYPEDQPRAMVVMHGGNETSRGFHTGTTIGDALHPKYVNNLPESLRVPLSGRWEQWTLLFNLHDRFPDLAFIRGAKERTLTAEDGFDVVIGQFSRGNDPTSQGIAVGRIRLCEVLDMDRLIMLVNYPPTPLPRRQIFWREEMADGVIEGNQEEQRGVKEVLDWYRFKAVQMRFLGLNTFSKDLLEFGACQHWDSTPHGGNDWVFFSGFHKDLWPRIVNLLGQAELGFLPYYEYSGSKGYKGLGNQRRAKPLTRDDAYTHISWIESANADLTDPDTYRDFQKMLDLTVLRLKGQARFEGIWLRPRSQLPMSFADATRARFAAEVNDGKNITRAELQQDAALLRRYEAWWFDKRRQFLVAMRDYLRTNGLPESVVLYTTDAGEPGPGFPTWDKILVTDDPPGWQPRLDLPEHIRDNRKYTALNLTEVLAKDLYLQALQSAPLNWGKWEVHHANPAADPARYRDTPGVLLTHAFNRKYTVSSPTTFDQFRGPSGLAVIRHHTLNEDMMFDRADKPKLGYFVADVERAGPYCMMAEALAVANGDPTMLGYLLGNNLGRGFPQYVREFNRNFLALPALPSRRLNGACADPEVVVRAIETPKHGTYLAVVNTGYTEKKSVKLQLPRAGTIKDAASAKALSAPDGLAELSLYPFQLRALWLTP